jgi:hypothetical protein
MAEKGTLDQPQALRARSSLFCPPVRQRPVRDCCCITPADPPDRPDPAIYSQVELLANGVEPSWNSPDITTNFWSPWRLMVESEVKVRNLSATASAVNVHVHFYISTFGIGTARTLLLSRMLNLAPSQEALLKFPLPQSVLADDPLIGTHVIIEHSADANTANNRGSQTIYGAFTTVVGRSFQIEFPVRNPSAAAQLITLATLNNGLAAVVNPAARVFAGFEQVQATLSLAVPNSLHGTPAADIRREVSVVGRDASGQLIDGLTYIVRIDN